MKSFVIIKQNVNLGGFWVSAAVGNGENEVKQTFQCNFLANLSVGKAVERIFLKKLRFEGDETLKPSDFTRNLPKKSILSEAKSDFKLKNFKRPHSSPKTKK